MLRWAWIKLIPPKMLINSILSPTSQQTHDQAKSDLTKSYQQETEAQLKG